jgi:hypothetical protein
MKIPGPGGWPDLHALTKTGCPIFAASFAAKVGIGAKREPVVIRTPNAAKRKNSPPRSLTEKTENGNTEN